jgi:hypothetical protein
MCEILPYNGLESTHWILVCIRCFDSHEIVQDFGLMDMFLTFVVKQNAGTWDIPRVAITLFIFGGADAVNRDIGFSLD